VNRGAIIALVAMTALGVAGAAWVALRQVVAVDLTAATFVTPQPRRIASAVVATGVVRLRSGAEVRVGSQVSGIVQQLNVTVGSKIRRSDVIARIDDRVLKARLRQAQAQSRVVEQSVRRAQSELARLRQLAAQQLVARRDLDNAELTLAEAEAQREKARRDSDAVVTDLRYTVIHAPISGTVASVSTQEGETVAASFTAPTFVTIIADDALQLIAMVDETDIGSVQIGAPVTFTVEAFPAEEFTGEVERIAPKGTIISGVVNYEVMIRVSGKLRLLRPDMTANVSLRTAERDVLLVPDAAVQREAGERFVSVRERGGLQRREVTLGARSGGYTEIRRGLAAGEQVLLGPVQTNDSKGKP
jgi:macrolide-specific efflux system membrane fusion protein